MNSLGIDVDYAGLKAVFGGESIDSDIYEKATSVINDQLKGWVYMFGKKFSAKFLREKTISKKGKFKSPSIRNIELTAPYMHDGRFNTLEEVIEHYNFGGHNSLTIDPLMKRVDFGLGLNNQDKIDLINFLKTLTDSTFINNQNFKP